MRGMAGFLVALESPAEESRNFVATFAVYTHREHVAGSFCVETNNRGYAFAERIQTMTPSRMLQRMGTCAAAIGLVLYLPLTMRAQIVTPPQESSGVAVPQSTAQAERGMRPPHPPSARRQLKHLSRMLNLTQEQQQQMLPVLRNRNKQMRALREDASLQPRQRRQQMRELMRQTDQKLEAAMTDPQKQKFEAMRERREQRMRGRGMGPEGMRPPGGPPPAGEQPGNPPPPPPPDGQAPPQQR